MVLYDIPDGSHFLVELAAALYAEGLGHRDLHALDVVAVPDRLEERVRETKDDEILHRLLAEIMIDAKDRRLVEDGVDDLVEALRGGQVATERLLDDDARV